MVDLGVRKIPRGGYSLNTQGVSMEEFCKPAEKSDGGGRRTRLLGQATQWEGATVGARCKVEGATSSTSGRNNRVKPKGGRRKVQKEEVYSAFPQLLLRLITSASSLLSSLSFYKRCTSRTPTKHQVKTPLSNP